MLSALSPEKVQVNKNNTKPLVIIGALFFIFGFITWLSSVLIPYLQIACELNNFQAYLVAFAFYISYFVMSVPSGWILKRSGFKNGMSIGLFTMAVGSLLFIPAALSRTYSTFLVGLFVQGTGMAILQTASNPYLTVLGPRESAARRISIMGICNGVAGAIAPIILGSVILNDADSLKKKIGGLNPAQKTAELNNLVHLVIKPYIIIVLVLIVLAILVYKSSLPEIDTEEEDENVASANVNKTSIMQFPHLLLGVITLFLYVGVEVIAGNTIINYAALQGIALSNAKFFTSLTLVGMLAGYIVGIICIPKYITQEKALKISSVLGLVFISIALYTHGYTSVFFIAMLGVSNSLIWPSIWPLAIDGLGRFTKTGSSLLVMAIAGGAVIPLAYGYLADNYNAKLAYLIVIPCYAASWLYATWGHKIRVATKRS
ncbi:glucose/galactose MFS transporter [Mucilaginibacter terrigena]|uniref:Glucose/galactose MFS transporter n=1 Tax=Mucilaginibacter terrigena TaxID=2492395 RepID=A0A4Q5LME0_9SPHI|nr:sugar MFS transporter [Mucilaginibacter terrigena]RYU90924.1 glucose/galactose MFS transporter [Mucilaginibacter terrigena]